MTRPIDADEDEEQFFGAQAIDRVLFDELDEWLDLPAPQTAHSFPLPVLRPQTRAECKSVPRPCPFVSCRYNLYLDVRGDGVMRINFPDREPDEMTASCTLDLADDGPRTLDAVAAMMGMSKERARQLEQLGLHHVKKMFTQEDAD